MKTPHDIRRLALLGVYQLDTRADLTDEELARVIDEASDLTDDVDGSRFTTGTGIISDRDLRRAADLARAAWLAKETADAEISALTPEWPTRRQGAIDRAIFRLAHYEITAERIPHAVAIDEAVRLAKAFGSEKSPSFINGVLGRFVRDAASPEPAADPAP
jgi:N utilization substance protein B